jgi:hypothetical protein
MGELHTHPSQFMNVIYVQPQSFHGHPSPLQHGAPDIRERSLRERNSRIRDQG